MAWWIKNLLIALDQLVNAALGGFADETLSSRAWRLYLAGRPEPCLVVDAIFFWQDGHCRQAYESERLGRQRPPELR